ARFAANPKHYLIGAGVYLRNVRVLHQLPPIGGWNKLRLLHRDRLYEDRNNIDYWNRLGTRRDPDTQVEPGSYVSHAKYDDLFAANVVVTELYAAAANNLVVECIARNTPIVVNRLPATMEYLGADYPLLFEDLEEIPELLAFDSILAAHHHLTQLDKSWLDGR